MPSPRRTPLWSKMLLLLSLGVLSRAACTTKFFSLPAVRYGPHVYMLETQSADDICRWMGYSKSGAIKETTLHILGLPVSAITMKPFEINKDRSARILVAVECLKAGQKACTMDKDGNIGNGNKGKNNFGDYNIGDWNIGSSNKGNLNWGDNNKGTRLRCNNAIGTRNIINDCNLTELRKSVLKDYNQSPLSPPKKASPPPPQKASLPPPKRASPPPPKKASPPSPKKASPPPPKKASPPPPKKASPPPPKKASPPPPMVRSPPPPPPLEPPPPSSSPPSPPPTPPPPSPPPSSPPPSPPPSSPPPPPPPSPPPPSPPPSSPPPSPPPPPPALPAPTLQVQANPTGQAAYTVTTTTYFPATIYLYKDDDLAYTWHSPDNKYFYKTPTDITYNSGDHYCFTCKAVDSNGLESQMSEKVCVTF